MYIKRAKVYMMDINRRKVKNIYLVSLIITTTTAPRSPSTQVDKSTPYVILRVVQLRPRRVLRTLMYEKSERDLCIYFIYMDRLKRAQTIHMIDLRTPAANHIKSMHTAGDDGGQLFLYAIVCFSSMLRRRRRTKYFPENIYLYKICV